MQVDSSQNRALKQARRTSGTRAKRRQWGLDRRTRQSKQLQLRVAELSRQFGVDVDDPTLKRAAELSVYAEEMRRGLIQNIHSVGIANVVKIENLTSRSLRDLAIKAKTKESSGPTFGERLAQELAGEAAT